jgi:predicted ABC-type transport system involved in lysophospholipase L1 biosynthesis ATPase subunit
MLPLVGVKGARARTTEMLKRVGLGERLDPSPKVLSGGEQRRVALGTWCDLRCCWPTSPLGLDFATGETVMQ